MSLSKRLYANNVRTTLSGAISAVATTLSVQSGAGATMPSPNNALGEFFDLTLQDQATGLRTEIVAVTAVTGDVLTIVRGQQGTTGQVWSAGDTAFLPVTKGAAEGWLQPVDVQDGHLVYADASGTTTAYTATYSPAIATLVDGMELNVDITSVGTNTTITPTFSPNGLTAHTITRQNSVALAVGDMPNQCIFRYQSSTTSWILLNPLKDGGLVGVQVFSTVGTATYTPTAGTSYIIVEVVGGGAAGGSCAAAAGGTVSAGGGGGAGAYAKVKITSAFSGVTVTVGAAGTPSAAGNNAGGSGGTSSFGALISCPGGTGTGNGGAAITPSSVSNSSSGGAGGAAPTISGTTILSMKGDTGKGGFAIPSATASVQTGSGGFNPLGTPGYAFNGSVAGIAAGGYGAGGSGAASVSDNTARQGGAGAQGVVIVWEYR